MLRVLICLLLLGGSAFMAEAGKVVLWLQITNPASEPRPYEIKSNLPAGIGTDDILNLGDLDLKYDIKNDLYYVHKQIELGAKGSGTEHAEYRIELNDIWVIPEEELTLMDQQAKTLAGLLAKSAHEETASDLLKLIDDNLRSVKARQDANSVDKVTAVNHIRAYEECAEDLERIKLYVGRMENLVLSTGQDPGQLVGKVKDIPKPDRDFELKDEEYKTAVIVIKVENTSPTETRMIPNSTTPPISRELPAEIKPRDVLNQDELKALGMELRTDANRGVCYVYVPLLEIEPKGVKVFNVKIRDKWNVNEPRVKSLKEVATLLLEQLQSAKTKVPTVNDMVQTLIEKLDAVEKEASPTTLDDKYVAFFRDQSNRLDAIEEQMNRIRAALKPMQQSSKLGFKAKPPTMKSTWMIIYIILGFLAVISLLFFLRWYGKSKEEQLNGAEQ